MPYSKWQSGKRKFSKFPKSLGPLPLAHHHAPSPPLRALPEAVYCKRGRRMPQHGAARCGSGTADGSARSFHSQWGRGGRIQCLRVRGGGGKASRGLVMMLLARYIASWTSWSCGSGVSFLLGGQLPFVGTMQVHFCILSCGWTRRLILSSY